jgi:hypothetical protein
MSDSEFGTVAEEITVIEETEEEKEQVCPDPSEPSTILYRVMLDPEPRSKWDKYIVDIYAYEGGGAEYEQEFGGFLDYTVVDMLDLDTQEGFYVMEGFCSYYSKDYWGEVDCDHEFTCIRKATDKDWKYFGVKPEDGTYEL